MPPIGDYSETDSDSLHSDDGAALTPDSPFVFPTWDPRHPDWSSSFPPFQFNDVRRDAQNLLDFNMGRLEKTILDTTFLSSSSRLLHFLETFPTIPLENDNDGVDILAAFSILVEPKFLERLFEYRKIFRRASIKHTKSTRGYSVVATWVDEFLAKLCSSTIILAAGSHEPPLAALSESIQAQLDRDVIQAVCQLPDGWEGLKTAIGSPNFSPAARRMAISLMFAAYVMGPSLGFADTLDMKNDHCPVSNQAAHPLSHPRHPPVELLDNLFDCARIIYAKVQSPPTFLHERVTAAMLLSLFPIVDRIEGSPVSLLRPAQLRPESLGYLLDLFLIIMGKDAESFVPLKNLDVAQIILLRWGEAVPWSWSTWTDQRSADTEYLCSATSTWFYHLNKPLFSTILHSDDDRMLHTDLRRCLLADVEASSSAVLVLLQNISSGLNDAMDDSRISLSPLLLGLLGKLCWSTIQYLENDIIKINDSVHARIPEYTQCLLLLFCRLQCSLEELFVRDIIIEALSLVRDGWIPCIQNVIQNKSAQFVRKLDQVARYSVRTLSEEKEGEELHRQLRAAKSLLEFLTIISFNCPSLNNAIEETALFFFDKTTSFLKRETHYASTVRRNLLAPLLTAACVFAESIDKWDKAVCVEDIWTLSLHLGAKNLLNAAMFAQFILVSKGPYEPLMCYEAWDLLSSTLTAIVDGRCISEQEEPLALLTCVAICFALRKLVCACSLSTRISIISSPWTISFRATLASVVEATSPTSDYIQKICTRIAKEGKELARELAKEPDEISEPADAPDNADSSIRLLYYCDPRYSGLLVTTELGTT